jgi:hypothetical protein
MTMPPNAKKITTTITSRTVTTDAIMDAVLMDMVESPVWDCTVRTLPLDESHGSGRKPTEGRLVRLSGVESPTINLYSLGYRRADREPATSRQRISRPIVVSSVAPAAG